MENRCTRLKWIGLSFACTKGLRYLLWVRKRRERKKNLDRKIGHQGVRRVGKFSLQAHKKPINPSDPFSSFGISSSWTMNICSSHHHLLHCKYTNSLVNSDSFYVNFNNTTFQKISIPHLTLEWPMLWRITINS